MTAKSRMPTISSGCTLNVISSDNGVTSFIDLFFPSSSFPAKKVRNEYEIVSKNPELTVKTSNDEKSRILAR